MCLGSVVNLPGHTYHGQTQATRQRNFVARHGGVTERRVQRLARQRCHDVGPAKSRGDHCAFAVRHDRAADPLASPCRMNKEGADARRVSRWIERGVFAFSTVITTEKRPASAPATTTYDPTVSFGDEVGAIANELAVDAEHRSHRRLHLLRGVVAGLQ